MSATEQEVKPRGRGRPSTGGAAAEWYESELYKLLHEAFPGFVRAGRLHVGSLADAVDVSSQTVYRSLQNNTLSEEVMAGLVKASRSHGRDFNTEIEPLTPEQLVGFLPAISALEEQEDQ